MKVYFYADEEVGIPWGGPDYDHKRHGFPEPRFNWCEFPGFDETSDPGKADVFVMRQRLSQVNNDILAQLPYLKGNELRHVFFDLSEDFGIYPAIAGSMQFRGCADKTMMMAQSNIIPIAWPVEDLGPSDENPIYDVSFQGQHNELADRAMESCVKASLKCNFNPLEEFWPHIRNKDPVRGAELRQSFPKNISSAKLSLCPRTLERGSIRYRFYEAMTLNRMSVLIGDDCRLPFSEKLDWPYCSIWLTEATVDDTGRALAAFLNHAGDSVLEEKGHYAREMWLKWLSRAQYGKVIAEKVKEIISAGY